MHVLIQPSAAVLHLSTKDLLVMYASPGTHLVQYAFTNFPLPVLLCANEERFSSHAPSGSACSPCQGASNLTQSLQRLVYAPLH